MSDISTKYFGLVSCVFALIIASAVCITASHKGYSDVRANATTESGIIVAITSGFVRTYSKYQANFEEGQLPNPALFRAESLRHTDQNILAQGGMTSVVGLPGREIANTATDEQMRQQMSTLQEAGNSDVLESVYTRGNETIHRTLWPFFASEAACADCHNRLQNLTGEDQWKVGDLMGAQHVDQNIAPQLAKMKRTTWLVSVLVFLTVFAGSYWCLILYRQFHLSRELKTLATTDSMTGCINRREMYTRISRLTGHASGAVLMLDLDRFKHINDTHGHAVGDAVITDFSTRVKSALRSNDWVARIGGEEFVVWLPDVKPRTALLIAQRLCKDCESNPLQLGEATISYTVSIGLHIVDKAPPSKIDAWLKAADLHLYQAKNEGRNRVVFSEELMV